MVKMENFDMTCKVLKFGGSILGTREHFEKVADVVVGELEKGTLPVYVVSAISGITDSLVEAVYRVMNDGGFDTHEFVESLYERYRVTLPVGIDGVDLKQGFDQLEHTLEYISSSGELNDSLYAFSVSKGEVFSCQVLAYHLRSRGVDETPIFKGEDLLVTDNDYRARAPSWIWRRPR
jgi:aspartokinase/homoserine dehydrogenase 1